MQSVDYSTVLCYFDFQVLSIGSTFQLAFGFSLEQRGNWGGETNNDNNKNGQKERK